MITFVLCALFELVFVRLFNRLRLACRCSSVVLLLPASLSFCFVVFSFLIRTSDVDGNKEFGCEVMLPSLVKSNGLVSDDPIGEAVDPEGA